jgi:hypothetical protein
MPRKPYGGGDDDGDDDDAFRSSPLTATTWEAVQSHNVPSPVNSSSKKKGYV